MKIAFTGDLSFMDIEKFTANPFAKIEKKLSKMNLIINLESPFLPADQEVHPIKEKICIMQSDKNIARLDRLNPLLINLANNHINDYGKIGVNHTISILKKHNIPFLGAGLANENHNIFVMKKEKIAFFSYVTRESDLTNSKLFNTKDFLGPKEFSLPLLNSQFKPYAGYIKIVLLHWGYENEHYPLPKQREVAKQIIRAGADLIIGNHPHVIQGYEKYQNKWIFYSLGNFLLPAVDAVIHGKVERLMDKAKNRKSLLPVFDITKNQIRLDNIHYTEANDKFEVDFRRKHLDYKILFKERGSYKKTYELYHFYRRIMKKTSSIPKRIMTAGKVARSCKEYVKSKLVTGVYEPLYCKLHARDNRLKIYKFFKKAQWNSLEDNRKYQARKLYELIKYASANIPYYRNAVKKHKITFSEKTIFEDIKKFPVLTKDLLKKEFENLYKTRPKSGWYKNTSGGTTGDPVTLIQDNDYQAQASPITRLQFEWTGYRLGETQIKLWGSERDILKEKENFKRKFANWVNSIYILNSFMMDEQKMRDYVDYINRKKPSLILSYARAINELAKFINAHNLKVHSPKAVMTSAGKLYPDFRVNIERAFKCPVFDRYGSREVGNIASECDKHEGLHVSIFTHYIEILDKKLRPCKEGETGDIYVTLLTNYTMPLIRYKIGDTAVYTKKHCSCGRGLPMIKEIVGRDLDNFITKDGRILHGGLFVHFIGVVFNNGGIKQFQVIQKEYDKMDIKVVLNSRKLFDEKKDEIESFIKKMVSPKCQIKWIFVKSIPTLKSGKFRYTLRAF